MSYHIKISNFDGPFDLLFQLIEKNEVDIYDIPIAEIAKQYLVYINSMETLDLDVASEFVLMAATLLQIKSKMLLPKDTISSNEISADEDDPRAELVQRLIEYKKYKDISDILKNMEEEHLGIFYKNPEIIDDIEEDKIFLNVTLSELVDAINNVLTRYKQTSPKDVETENEIFQEEFSVDDKIIYIQETIRNNKKVYFKDFFSNLSSKLEIIITFIALLELIHLEKIIVYQEMAFSNIIVQNSLIEG